ncbi:hypothetical protein SEA_TOMAS_81 [Streptomyces phage Tomas]|uniref:Uncharacterized protein n=1 Tax=Streptomyces phage Tomas TaxID=2914443 RepID=A0AA49H0Z1_9CAUD|nr:hypothetical protein PP453_gp198 [Streptomyces phage Tomas]UMO76428.1 hypothetical protein SEA_TOMAS_81 [Streptomyces phage Tomas]
MHSHVKRFQVDGIMKDDADFPRLRAQFEDMLMTDMRDRGYIPVFDLGPFFSTEYRHDRSYNFVISAYGIYLGRRRAWEISGICNGQQIPMSTPKSK